MICIAGKNEIAVKATQVLLEKVKKDEICVLTNATDQGEDGWQPSLLFFAQEHQLRISSLQELYDDENLIFLSLEFDKIIKPSLFKSSKLYNIHFSCLPKYKGMFTSVMPLLNGEHESGVTLHRIDAGIDTGEIIAQIKFPLSLADNARDLYQKYLDSSFLLFKNNIDSILKNKIVSYPQNPVGASYYSRKTIDFSAISVDFNKTSYEIHNQIRAFCFRDYQLPKFNDNLIYKSELTHQVSAKKTGTIVFETEEFVELSTIDYNIKLFKDYYQQFWQASMTGDLISIKKIIDLIPDINLRNKNGWNAIILATYNHHVDVVMYLLSKGANVNATNYKGTSVLMYAKDAAIANNDYSIISLILDASANINHTDNTGRTVLDYAKLNDNKDMVHFLMTKGAVYND